MSVFLPEGERGGDYNLRLKECNAKVCLHTFILCLHIVCSMCLVICVHRSVCWRTEGLAVGTCEYNSLAEFEHRRKETSPLACHT